MDPLFYSKTKMAPLLQEWSKTGAWEVIRFLRAQEKVPTKIHNELKAVYGDNVMCQRQVCRWCSLFVAGQTSLEDEQRAGRNACVNASIRTTLNNSTVLSMRTEDLKFVIFLRPFRVLPHGQTINSQRYCETLDKL